MIKRILLTLSLVIIAVSGINYVSLADNLKEGATCYANSDCAQGLICHIEGINAQGNQTKFCRNLVDVLTQRANPLTQSNNTPPNKDLQNVQKLPDVSLEGGMTLAIKAILRSAMLLTIIAIVVAAIYYIISRGKDEDMTKAKDIILYLVMGMAIIAAAYGIVAGITQFNVFG